MVEDHLGTLPKVKRVGGRPSQFFYQALGLETVREPFDIIGFYPTTNVCVIKVQDSSKERGCGKCTFELSYREVLSILEGQRIYLPTHLPPEVYRFLKAAAIRRFSERSSENLLKDSDFSDNALSQLEDRFPYYTDHPNFDRDEFEAMTVKKTRFLSFVDLAGRIVERKPGSKDMIELISYQTLDISQHSTKIGKGRYGLITDTLGLVFNAIDEGSVLVLPPFNEDYYWEAFFREYLLAKKEVDVIFCVSTEEEKNVFDRKTSSLERFRIYVTIQPHVSILSYAVELKRAVDRKVYLLNGSKVEAEITGTYGLDSLSRPIATWRPLIYKDTRVPELYENISPTQIVIRQFGYVLPELPQSLVELKINSIGLEELPLLPDGLKVLECEYNRLKNLPDLPHSLEILKCFGNEKLKHIPQLPPNLKILSCGRTKITHLSLPKGLKVLNISLTDLTKFPTLPGTLEELVCSSNVWFTRLPSLPKSLKILDCENSELRFLPELPLLEELVCGLTKIKSLPELPESLVVLDCRDTNINSIPKLPRGLRELECSRCSLTYLPKLNKKLKILVCSFNRLTELPKLHLDLVQLECGDNLLTNLPRLRKNLEILICNNNLLTDLPKLSKRLVHIECSNNKLANLPQLPNKLTILLCSNNKINELPELPDTLMKLHVDGNRLAGLPQLPKLLWSLNCDKNSLKTLPSFPEGVAYIYCGNNRLSVLPPLPDSLIDLRCASNRLTSLPPLPDSLRYLDCQNNRITELAKTKEMRVLADPTVKILT